MFILNNTQTDHGSIMHCAMCRGRFTALGGSRSCGNAVKSSRCGCPEWQGLDDVRRDVILGGLRRRRSARLAV